MSCFSPICVKGQSLPCGGCMDCRMSHAQMWKVRAVHESRMHRDNCFITLTYRDEDLPLSFPDFYPTFNYYHFQCFMKKLRKRFGEGIRFIMCAEYGEKFSRPHYHACLFGVSFDDMYKWRKTHTGAISYRSPKLEKLWIFGNCEVSPFSPALAGYLARYVTKKMTGEKGKEHYQGRTPEFFKCSTNPGIGYDFLMKYFSDVFPHDHVIFDGRPLPVPRYYMKLLERMEPEFFDVIKDKRSTERLLIAREAFDKGYEAFVDYSREYGYERLAVKAQVKAAQMKSLTRSFEVV